MDLTFWSAIKILFGIYCIVGLLRFVLYGIGVFLGNIITGALGGILGGIAAGLYVNYSTTTTPWYVIIPIGILVGSILNNIIRDGLVEHLRINLSVLWDLFKRAFLFKRDSSGSVTTTHINKRTERSSCEPDSSVFASSKNAGYSQASFGSNNCSNCCRSDNGGTYCQLHNKQTQASGICNNYMR